MNVKRGLFVEGNQREERAKEKVMGVNTIEEHYIHA
jgi:hypothetical protein